MLLHHGGVGYGLGLAHGGVLSTGARGCVPFWGDGVDFLRTRRPINLGLVQVLRALRSWSK